MWHSRGAGPRSTFAELVWLIVAVIVVVLLIVVEAATGGEAEARSLSEVSGLDRVFKEQKASELLVRGAPGTSDEQLSYAQGSIVRGTSKQQVSSSGNDGGSELTNLLANDVRREAERERDSSGLSGLRGGRSSSSGCEGGCADNATCYYSYVTYTYVCACDVGFSGDGATKCNDTDECAVSNGGCTDLCVNTHGSYFCDCPAGSAVSSSGFGCEPDFDECTAGTHTCEAANDELCVNTDGSFVCECKPGFHTPPPDRRSVLLGRSSGSSSSSGSSGVSSSSVDSWEDDSSSWGARNSRSSRSSRSGGLGCVDIDECTTGPPPCDQVCTNSPGSYSCSCIDGYELEPDGRSCADIDECDPALGPSPCEKTCINTPGSFVCTCPNGYILAADMSSCVDVDECAAGPSPCDGNCTNTAGSYECSCPEGYALDPVDGSSCLDINECLDPELAVCNGTLSGSLCNNTLGSYVCYCPPGYYMDILQGGCMDIDECGTSGMMIGTGWGSSGGSGWASSSSGSGSSSGWAWSAWGSGGWATTSTTTTTTTTSTSSTSTSATYTTRGGFSGGSGGSGSSEGKNSSSSSTTSRNSTTTYSTTTAYKSSTTTTGSEHKTTSTTTGRDGSGGGRTTTTATSTTAGSTSTTRTSARGYSVSRSESDSRSSGGANRDQSGGHSRLARHRQSTILLEAARPARLNAAGKPVESEDAFGVSVGSTNHYFVPVYNFRMSLSEASARFGGRGGVGGSGSGSNLVNRWMARSGRDGDRGGRFSSTSTSYSSSSGGGGLCGTGLECVNTPGSYSCVNIDECSANYTFPPVFYPAFTSGGSSGLSSGGSGSGGTSGTPSTFSSSSSSSSSSSPSYYYSPPSWGAVLPCGEHGVCMDTYGSFTCVCPTGFVRDSATGRCVDDDECTVGFAGSSASPCDNASSVCVNTVGSFTCECRPGYTSSDANSTVIAGPIGCVNINECGGPSGNPFSSISSSGGGANATCPGVGEVCVDTPGSFACVCDVGYTAGSSGGCVDIDECAVLGSGSGSGSGRRSTGGSESSTSPSWSYTGTSGTSEEDGDAVCSSDELCVNTAGSFDCVATSTPESTTVTSSEGGRAGATSTMESGVGALNDNSAHLEATKLTKRLQTLSTIGTVGGTILVVFAIGAVFVTIVLRKRQNEMFVVRPDTPSTADDLWGVDHGWGLSLGTLNEAHICGSDEELGMSGVDSPTSGDEDLAAAYNATRDEYAAYVGNSGGASGEREREREVGEGGGGGFGGTSRARPSSVHYAVPVGESPGYNNKHGGNGAVDGSGGGGGGGRVGFNLDALSVAAGSVAATLPGEYSPVSNPTYVHDGAASTVYDGARSPMTMTRYGSGEDIFGMGSRSGSFTFGGAGYGSGYSGTRGGGADDGLGVDVNHNRQLDVRAMVGLSSSSTVSGGGGGGGRGGRGSGSGSQDGGGGGRDGYESPAPAADDGYIPRNLTAEVIEEVTSAAATPLTSPQPTRPPSPSQYVSR